MDSSPARRYCWYFLVMALAAGAGISCRDRKKASTGPAVVIAETLRGNRLGGLASPVYQSQAGSAIAWQPWGKEALRAASDANRLVLVVVVMPQQQGFSSPLRELEKDQVISKAIRDTYVPVLVDGELVREMGLFADPLCREIKRQLEMPIFIWMTPEGNPVAWIPISGAKPGEANHLFLQSHGMVERMWRDDAAYVRSNSLMDNNNRRDRFKEQLKAITPAENPAMEALNGTRQLLSLYDPVSRSIDETGGLFPLGPLDVSTASGLLPGVPGPLRKRGGETTTEMLKDLLASAMFDPLEGAAFSGRVDRSWALPMFGWNCQDQAKVAASLFRAHRLTGDRATLERALGVLDFAERRFSGEDGLFRFGAITNTSPREWMWTVGEVKEALPEGEDAEWWIAATGMQELGNLPPEVDSARNYFRANTLSLVRPLEETAASLGVDATKFRETYEKSRVKLRAVREARWKTVAKDDTPNAAASFRMVSAYAAAYTATGGEIYREKAAALLARAQDGFFKEGVLKAVLGNGGAAITDARVFVHALAVQSAQDVADITLDPSALATAEKIARAAVENFIVEDQLVEVSPAASVMDLPVVDSYRVYDDSSGGVFAITEARSAGHAADFAEALRRLGKSLPSNAAASPVLYTDSILAALVKHHSRTLLLGSGLSPEMSSAVSRLPLQLFPRTAAKDSDGIPAGSVRVISPDGTGKVIANPADLLKELLLSDQQP